MGRLVAAVLVGLYNAEKGPERRAVHSARAGVVASRAGEARSRGSQEANRQREARAALNDQLKRFGVGTRHVRQWARDSGHTVRDSGGLPLGIIREFLHAHEIPMPT
jgi:hypothetical protein